MKWSLIAIFIMANAFGGKADRNPYSIIFATEKENENVFLVYELSNRTRDRLVVYKDSLPEGFDISHRWLSLYLFPKNGDKKLKADVPPMINTMGLKVEIPRKRSLTGRFNLSKQFNSLEYELTKNDVWLFWTYLPHFRKGKSQERIDAKRTEGFLVIPKGL